MQLNINGHASDECLEQYALGLLEEPLLGEIEEHLLICSQCQEHLQEIDAYRAAMRSAAAHLQREDESRKRFWAKASEAFTFRRLGWTLGLGAVILAAMSLLVWMKHPPMTPVAFALEANRGAEIRHAPAGRPLILNLETTGLPPYASYGVETVSAAGRVEMHSQASAEKLIASLPNGLRPGNYFIRVYSPSHELLREYGLVVE